MGDLDPPPSHPPPPATGDNEAKSPRAWRTWHLATIAVVALLLGVGMGSAGEDAEVENTDLAADEAAEFEERIAVLEEELASRNEDLAAAEDEIEQLQEEPESEPEPEQDPESEPDPEPEPEVDSIRLRPAKKML